MKRVSATQLCFVMYHYSTQILSDLHKHFKHFLVLGPSSGKSEIFHTEERIPASFNRFIFAPASVLGVI